MVIATEEPNIAYMSTERKSGTRSVIVPDATRLKAPSTLGYCTLVVELLASSHGLWEGADCA